MAGDLMPQTDIEDELIRLSRLLDQATRKILQRALASAKADSLYKREFAKALLMVDGGSVQVKEAKAITAPGVWELYDQRKIKEAVLQSAVEAARNLRAQLEAMRSINTNQRFFLERAS
ncbi:MAG: hypothetical protein AB7H43_15445 [Acidimicrobiia bacterium]